MSALGYIRTSLPKWDLVKKKDYKIRRLIFVCPRTMFIQLPDVKYLTWFSEDIIYGVMQFPAPIRLAKCAKIMPHAEFFKGLKSQYTELIKMAGNDKEKTEREITKVCFEYYLDYLQYQL